MSRWVGAMLVGLAVLLASAIPAHAATATAEADRMLDAIIDDARRTASYTGQGTIAAKVLDALRRVDRSAFVPEAQARFAFENHPLPIGHGQTISQPFIVALMTDLLDIEPDHRILEIGTGSGYQAAILGELAADVFSVEIVPELALASSALLENLGYANVAVKQGDGWYGWEEHAPFDGVIVTAVADEVPPRLLAQLKPGGRMILPVRQQFEQMLILVTKTADGSTQQRDVLPVRFVPLTGDHGAP